jgi:UDP-glucose 4-epimerase
VRALVTGGAGFVGSNLVLALCARGWDVAVLDNLLTGQKENLDGLPVEFVEGDVSVDSDPCIRSLCEGRDVVFHLAAVPLLMSETSLALSTNVRGTCNVLEAACLAKVPRVVLASSVCVYGDGFEVYPLKEGAPLQPTNFYAASKCAAEAYARAFWERRDLHVVTLRYSNIYGPRQLPEKAKRSRTFGRVVNGGCECG